MDRASFGKADEDVKSLRSAPGDFATGPSRRAISLNDIRRRFTQGGVTPAFDQGLCRRAIPVPSPTRGVATTIAAGLRVFEIERTGFGVRVSAFG
jgi:hypothetical protein